MDTARRPTLLDVARAAGVSHQSVSRVLNGERYVTAVMRERVLAAVAEVGYRRNALARALVTQRSRTVGVLAPASAEQGVQRRVAAVELAARDRGYSVLLTTADPLDAASLRAGLDRLLGQGVEGVVVVIAHEAALRAVAPSSSEVPHVLLASETLVAPDELRRRAPAVAAADGGGGAHLGVRHLLALGHRRVLHLQGERGWISAGLRLQAYRAELLAAGVAPLDPVEVGWSAAAGYAAGLRLLPGGGMTAVVAANDQVAMGWLHACHELGVAVPGDVSVVGYDDLPESAHTWPPLTTVRRDVDALGRRALDLLADELDPPQGGPPGGADDRPGAAPGAALVVRASTAPPQAWRASPGAPGPRPAR